MCPALMEKFSTNTHEINPKSDNKTPFVAWLPFVQGCNRDGTDPPPPSPHVHLVREDLTRGAMVEEHNVAVT